jgi:GTP-binding protein LepA
MGTGVEELLEAIVKQVPPPLGRYENPLQALIFDSFYDSYKGVVVVFRVMEGEIKTGDDIIFMNNDSRYEVGELGIFVPEMKKTDKLSAGEVGYLTAQIKTLEDVKMGDTITLNKKRAESPLSGFKEVKPMVFCGLYPTENTEYNLLKESLAKLKLNDASFIFEPETSNALGFGFRCGFLGMLHMEIIQERLEREFGFELIATMPNVVYHVFNKKGVKLFIDNPSDFPELNEINYVEDPVVKTTIFTPTKYMGAIMELCKSKRGLFHKTEYLSDDRAVIYHFIPLCEIIVDFFDQLKSGTKGYASLDYEFFGYKQSDLIKLEILIAGKPVDALCCIVHREFAFHNAKKIAEKLRQEIPRQQFEVPIQAVIGGKIIARETVKAFRKDVIAKCYGGDITRKRKLLEKQKKGKKRMKNIGNIQIPQEAFLAALGARKL